MTASLITFICVAPLLLSCLGGFGEQPLKEIVHDSGYAALNLLILTLAARPAVRLLGWSFLMQGRRWLGVACFLYACIHLGTHLLGTNLGSAVIIAEVRKKPFIIPGLVAFLLMAPLATTSTDAMVRRFGASWGRLHTLIYPAAVAVAVHYAWGMGEIRANVLFYSTTLGAVLAWRAQKAAGIRTT